MPFALPDAVHGDADLVIHTSGSPAGLAQAFNISLDMDGNYPHLNMHLHAGVPNGGRVEFHLGGWRIGETLFNGAPAPFKGWVTLPQKPGLGFTPKSGILDLAVKA